MRRTAWGMLGGVGLAAAVAVGQVGSAGPGPTGPTTVPTTAPVAAVVRSMPPDGPITPDGAVDVPYSLSATNHLIVRLKVNGHGPYNFVVDTGAPTMLLDEKVAADIGLKPDAPATRPAGTSLRHGSTTRGATTKPAGEGRRWATIDRLDIEGGLRIEKAKCLILTPYQITAMNSMGAAGVELHGLLGYSVLARFKMQIDLTKNRMVWTPQVGFTPPPLTSRGSDLGKTTKADEDREDDLESMGGVMKVLGPLVKMNMPGPAQPRGFLGFDLADRDGAAFADHVFADAPAAKAGVKHGDEVVAVDQLRVHSAADVQHATEHTLKGETVTLTVSRDGKTRDLKVVAGEGL